MTWLEHAETYTITPPLERLEDVPFARYGVPEGTITVHVRQVRYFVPSFHGQVPACYFINGMDGLGRRVRAKCSRREYLSMCDGHYKPQFELMPGEPYPETVPEEGADDDTPLPPPPKSFGFGHRFPWDEA